MALLYLDTSALVKLYVREPGSQRMLELASTAEAHQLTVCTLTQVEVHSAIRRRQRAGDLSGEEADQTLDRFDVHLRTRFMHQAINDQTLDLALELTARYFLRAYDAMQLAGCLILRITSQESPIFVCADRRLLDAAQSEELVILNPER